MTELVARLREWIGGKWPRDRVLDHDLLDAVLEIEAMQKRIYAMEKTIAEQGRKLVVLPEILSALEVCETVLGESAGEAYNVQRELSDVELGKLWIACTAQARAAIAKATRTS